MNLRVVDELGEGTVPELGADKVPLVRSGPGADLNGNSRSGIEQTLELGIVLRDLSHAEE